LTCAFGDLLCAKTNLICAFDRFGMRRAGSQPPMRSAYQIWQSDVRGQETGVRGQELGNQTQACRLVSNALSSCHLVTLLQAGVTSAGARVNCACWPEIKA
jgi:hypothetical protein